MLPKFLNVILFRPPPPTIKHNRVRCIPTQRRIQDPIKNLWWRLFERLINNFQSLTIFSKNRSSRPEVFCKKGVLRNFVKLTGKHLCQSLFYNKVAGKHLFLQNTFGGCFLKKFQHKYLIASDVSMFCLLLSSWKASFLRCSHQSCSIKKSVLKNFTKVQGKQLHRRLFFNKVAGSGLQLFVKFCEIFKNSFLTEHLWATAFILWNPQLTKMINSRSLISWHLSGLLYLFFYDIFCHVSCRLSYLPVAF